MSTTKTPKAPPAAPHHTPEGLARIAAASAANAKARVRVGGRFAKKDAPTPVTVLQSDTQAPAVVVTEATPAYDQHLADLGLIRSLEAKLADRARTIEQLQSERVFQNERVAALEAQLAEVSTCAKDRYNTIQGRNKEVQQLKAELAEAKTSEANLTTNLNLFAEQLTAISGMIPLELLPDAPTPERLACYLADLGEMADDWEATAGTRQSRIEELEQSLTAVEQGRDALQVERDQARGEVRALELERAGLWSRIHELEAKPTLPKRSLPRWLWVVQLVAVAAVALAFGIDAWLSAGGRHR